jgi:hypothetical protein
VLYAGSIFIVLNTICCIEVKAHMFKIIALLPIFSYKFEQYLHPLGYGPYHNAEVDA